VDDAQLDSSASRTLSITITTSPVLTFSTTSPLPSAMVGVSYTTNIFASGGSPGYTFSGTALPPGLTITATGLLFGTPTAAGVYFPVLTVVDQQQASVSTTFQITVTPPLSFVTTSPLPSGTATGAYSQTFLGSGGSVPYTFTITDTGPPGLTMSPAGILNGTPTAVGTFTFTVQLTDRLNFSISAKFQVTFAAPAPLLQFS